MKKICKSIVVIITILFLLCPICFGSDVNFNDQIKKEDGSLFEKIIAECIGGLAQAVFNFATSDTMGVGFKDYDTLIFNNNLQDDSISPFSNELWDKTMNWYRVFAVISGILILIAVFILSYKIMYAGMNSAKKNEAKDSLARLCFGGVAIALAPLFIRFLLYINNSMVHLLVTANNSSLDNFLGDSMISSIQTGNAIATALVISMFIYLFVKINIKFIIRQFTLIVFTIFTPIACGLWIINKNVTAASIWAGQIIMNIFMQFIYCFLFLIYLAFLPEGGGWAVSLIWAMMILPLADALQNSFQNLTSRIAGIDNEQMSNRALGMGAMLGYGLGAIKEQFNTPGSNSSSNSAGTNLGNGGGLSGIASRAKALINPQMNLTDSKDYNGNVNPIRDVKPKEKDKSVLLSKPNEKNGNKMSKGALANARSIAGGVTKAGKAYLKAGQSMAEGSFNLNHSNLYSQNMPYMKGTQNTEIANAEKKLLTEKSDSYENSKKG